MSHNFFIRCDGKYIRISTTDIRYIQSMKNYVRIVTTTKTYLVLITLQQLERELPTLDFCRVHRSFIVAINHISSFDQEMVYVGKDQVPINPGYKNALQAKV